MHDLECVCVGVEAPQISSNSVVTLVLYYLGCNCSPPTCHLHVFPLTCAVSMCAGHLHSHMGSIKNKERPAEGKFILVHPWQPLYSSASACVCWASKVSPTLGCSIEILRDIMSVCLSCPKMRRQNYMAQTRA